ncbi:unnamed protein product [Linum tenue]|uniref:Small ribosomal subunit protein mS23 n=1 Tax=Linum tenue TaxID=586396 RepID=A0AAV0IA38_9ROSI|nr:unnamed protein product [Linum tenue]
MSFMKGDLLSRTRRLVKGMAKAEPVWLKAMEQAPPATFPLSNGKIQKINVPEDPYIKMFFRKHQALQPEDPVKMSTIDPPPARVFAQRVLELKEQGVDGKAAISAADEEYKAERKAKRAAYARLKEIARLQGKEPPARPYPKSKRETLAEERWHSRKPRIFEIVRRLKDEMTADTNERFNRGY